jgi:hypothetical protein
MSNSGTFDWIFWLGLLSLMGWWYAAQIRHSLKKFSSRRWPSVNATIQKGGIGQVRGPKGSRANASFFGYAFMIQGVRYAGLFAIITNEEHGHRLQASLADGSILVRYDPSDANTSFIADAYDPRFEGLVATQDPEWLGQAPAFPLVDLTRR